MTNRVSIAFSWFLLVAGSLLQIWAFIFIRRRGVAPTMKDSLVLEEPYARIRRPMYSGLLCQFAGLGLFVPTIPVILAFLLGVGWAVIQAYLDTRLTCSRCRASFPGVGRQELERPKAIQAHKAVVCFAGTNNETNHILVTMRVLLAAHFTPAKNTG
jgi:hypothetical protein